jgi:hypothetical protein
MRHMRAFGCPPLAGLLLIAVFGVPAAHASEAPISSAAQLFTCCTTPALQDRLFEEAAASGARYVRVDVELHGIFGATGSRNHPDWRNLDAMIERARRYGDRVLGLIRGTPLWLSSCPNGGPKATICAPRDPKEWGRLAGEVAAHAKDSIDHWEILNEPDANWAFTGSAQDYARMLSAAYDAIKARAPEAKVVFGGVEQPRDHEWITRVFATPGADAAHKFDIAAVHLRLRLRNQLAELAQWLGGWRQLLRHYGFNGPIWVTEHGYPADPAFQWDPAYRGTSVGSGELAQADLLEHSVKLLAGAGAGQIFITLRDNLYGEYLSEGLVHIDDSQPGDPTTRRPAFGTVRNLAITWDPLVYARSGAREQLRQARELGGLAQASGAAGQPLAAAVQQGAAEGHAEVALQLVRAAEPGP